MEEKTVLTCPNKACGKVFAKPLTTLNLQQSSKESYNACPYCLTEITVKENESENPPEKSGTKATFLNETPNRNQENANNCKYHFGFVSEREKSQQIPEECMLCAEIMECMRKK